MAEPSDPTLASAQHQRDAALRRLSRLRAMTIAGAGALTAALAGVVSAVAPGHTLSAKATTPAPTALTARRTASPGRLPPLASPGQLGLQGPGSAPRSLPQPQATPAPPAPPAPAQAQPVSPPAGVVSGGS